MPSRRRVLEAGLAAAGLASGVVASQVLLRRHRPDAEPGSSASEAGAVPADLDGLPSDLDGLPDRVRLALVPDEAGSAPAGHPDRSHPALRGASQPTPLVDGSAVADLPAGPERAPLAVLPDGVEVLWLTLSDGTRLRVLARGDGPPVVLLHGITLSADVWFKQLRDLGDAGFRVVAPDLRGHGQSTVGTGGLLLDRVTDDIAEMLAELDLDDVILVGHSMGGMVALRLLTRHDAGAGRKPARDRAAARRIRALALVATSASPVVGRGVPGARAVIALAGPVLGATGRLTSSLRGSLLPDTAVGDPLARVAFGSSPSPADVRLVRRATAAVPTRIAASLLLQLVSFDAEKRLGRVAVPATVLVGTADVMTPLRHAETLAGDIPGAELVVLPDCGHMVMLERPVDTAAAIVALAVRAEAAIP